MRMSRFEPKKSALEDWSDSEAPRWSDDPPSEWAPHYTRADFDRADDESDVAAQRATPSAEADLHAPPLEVPFRTGPILCLYAVSGITALAIGVYASQTLVSALLGPTPHFSMRQPTWSEDAPSTDSSQIQTALPEGLTPEGATATRKQARAAKPTSTVARHTRIASASVPPARVDPNAPPDMDLMDIPSSPMERAALANTHSATPPRYDSAALIDEQATRDPLGKLELLQDSGAELGTLRINSRPWSHVYIDDRPVGTTPILTISLSSGTHNVRLVNEQFGLSKRFDVQIEPGESLSRVVSLD